MARNYPARLRDCDSIDNQEGTPMERTLIRDGARGVRRDVFGTAGVAYLSELSYTCSMGTMKGITIKLPETTLRRLRERARETGMSVAALVRESVEVSPDRGSGSVYAITADLAGSVSGGRRAATNERRRFRRS